MKEDLKVNFADEMYDEYYEYVKDRERICNILEISDSMLDSNTYSYLEHKKEENIREMWESKPWDRDFEEKEQFPSLFLDEEYQKYIEADETLTSLHRNAVAAGFHSIEKYLLWRIGS